MAESAEHLSVAALAKKTYLIPSQRRMVQESIDHLNFMLKDQETREVAMPNTDRIYANLRRDMQMLEEGTPPDYDAMTKNSLNALRKKLEEDIQRGMPTADMMERPIPNNIDLHIWWERENLQRVQAWKTICRTLDPFNDEPNFTSIARLRPSTPPKGNPRKYWQGFDDIKWQEHVESSIGTEIDDETYQTFIELKLMGWTSRTNICKELRITEAMYEAAMERFRTSRAAQLTREADEREAAAEAKAPIAPEPGAHKATIQRTPLHTKEPAPALMKGLKAQIEATGLSIHRFAQKYKIDYANLNKVIKGQAKAGPKMQYLIEKGLEAEQRVRGMLTPEPEAFPPQPETVPPDADPDDEEDEQEDDEDSED